MIQVRTFGALLALGALTALPGCSNLGFGRGESQYSQATPSTAYTAPETSGATAEASTPPAASTVHQPVTAEMVRHVQTRLQQEGLYHGRIDGLWGPQSRQAAMDFQQRHQLDQTGKIDLPMLQAMNLGTGNQQAGEENGAPAGNAGPNNQAGNQQYDETNNRAGGNHQPIPPSRDLTTGGQNNANENASNMPDQTNSAAPATGATGGTAANGSDISTGGGGPAYNAPANNSGQR